MRLREVTLLGFKMTLISATNQIYQTYLTLEITDINVFAVESSSSFNNKLCTVQVPMSQQPARRLREIEH